MPWRRTPRLVGRDQEIAALHAFLARARKEGHTLTMHGLPGAGVSTLRVRLQELAAAEGFTVIEFDAAAAGTVDFSGLHQLAALLAGHLPAAQHARLDGFRQGVLATQSDPQLRASETDTVVSLAAQLSELILTLPRPVLLTSEGMAGADALTVAVLLEMCTRVRVPGVALFSSVRAEAVDRLPPEVQVLRVTPLAAEAAQELLLALAPDMSEPQRQQAVQAAQGNPLALTELAEAADGVAGPGPRFTHSCRRRLAHIGAEAQQALLMLACHDQAPAAAWRALRNWSGLPATDAGLQVAVRSGLAYETPDSEVRFAHAWLGPVLLELTPAQQRRQAHATWAQALAERDPARSLHHRVHSTLGTDETLAQALDEQARRARQDGDEYGALLFAQQAVRFSAASESRSRRLVAAAYAATLSGRGEAAAVLLAQARRLGPQEPGQLPELVTTALLLMFGDGDSDAAYALVSEALQDLPDPGDAADPHVDLALRTLYIVASMGQQAPLWDELHRHLNALRQPLPPALDLSLQVARASRFQPVDPEHLERLIAQARQDTSVEDLRWLANHLILLERADEIVDLLEAKLPAMNDDSDGARIQFEFVLAYAAVRRGQWDTALRIARTGIERVSGQAPGLSAWALLGIEGHVGAHRGDADLARARSDQIMQWAVPRKIGAGRDYALQIRAAAAMAASDPEEALRFFRTITTIGQPDLGISTPVHSVLDVVQMAVRGNRPEQARAHLDAVSKGGAAQVSPYFALLINGAEAVLAQSAEAFEQALATPGAPQWPFEHARIELAFGEYLRRSGSVTRAKQHLSTARERFAQLGARPWSERAEAELAATGPSPGDPAPAALNRLSPQELQIATLAATGLTNKQIAERLFLSPRTVGNHLHRVFPKLGVTSRAGLGRALAGAQKPGPSGRQPE